jgi:hypothetical protein
MDKPNVKSGNRYGSVKVTSLPTGRRGKHHDLTEGIVRELKAAKEGMALVVPLADVGGVDLANLRSAVHRAASADNLEIETQADEKNFYVWLRKGSPPTNGAEKKLA